MPRMNMSDCKIKWDQVSKQIGQLSNGLENLWVRMLLDHPTDGLVEEERRALFRFVDRVQEAEETLSGLPYLCHPQSEWTGGRLEDVTPENPQSVTRAPHIVTDHHWATVKPNTLKAPLSIERYIKQAVPAEWYSLFEFDLDDSEDWGQWGIDTEVGKRVYALVRRVSLLLEEMLDLRPEQVCSMWESVSFQCRVWANG